jgi:cytidyltransferase-like protein
MTAQELIKELPKAVLMWYHFDKEPFVIDGNNIGDLEANCTDREYDNIVVTSVWETLKRPKDLFSYLHDKLNKNGRLFILMNNRLGLRYFCGDRDPYTGTVCDCLEGYLNYGFNGKGRLYDKSQIKRMLGEAGFEFFNFYAVFPDLRNPAIIFAEDYVPNEDLTIRIAPSYNSPKTIFIEEMDMYKGLSDNNMLHGMANAYLVECSLDGRISDINQVSSSLDRGRGDALFTILHKSGTVEKRAAYPEGKKRLEEIDRNHRELRKHGISVIDGYMEDGSYKMNYVKDEIAQVYFKRIIRTDVNKFISEMDRFRDIILKSSEIVSSDMGDGNGAVLRYGYLDMVTLNSFHMDDDFVFFDQEFRKDNYPANALIWRLVETYYAGDWEANSIYPMDRLLERYDLKRNQDKWHDMEWEFLNSIRNEIILDDYYKQTRMDKKWIVKNRERMQVPVFEALDFKRRYIDIFSNINGKMLILFGTGKYAKKFMELYGRDFPVYAMIDNDKEKWGKKFHGVRVESPEYLYTVQREDIKVIICMRAYAEVAEQLERMRVDNYSIYTPNQCYQTIPRTSVEIIDANGAASKDKKYHVGYVAGAFDMFHIGHLNLLRRAKEQCDYLIAGVMSDEKMFQLKNKYPVIPCSERLQVVAGCRYVDRVEELPTDRAGIRDAYHLFHFDCMFSGDDHADNKGWLEDREYLRGLGSDIVFLPYTQETSSTMIKEKLDEIY